MIHSIYKVTVVFSLVALLSACGHTPDLPESMRLRKGQTLDEVLHVPEPAATEIVVVVNYNSPGGLHAGLFTGNFLFDPSGSYRAHRALYEDNWPGPALADYVRFQMTEDGYKVMLYRFVLSPMQFEAIDRNAKNAGIAIPLFCATDVHNVFAGLNPFEGIPRRIWLSPATLSEQLDALTRGSAAIGTCRWPNGAACGAK